MPSADLPTVNGGWGSTDYSWLTVHDTGQGITAIAIGLDSFRSINRFSDEPTEKSMPLPLENGAIDDNDDDLPLPNIV